MSRQMPSVTVMGGGLAGLAASLYLAKSRMKVTLIEREERLGGRASSVVAEGGELVDYGLHVFCRHYLNLLAAMVEANHSSDGRISWFHETAYIDSSLTLRRNTLDKLPSPLHLARFMLEPTYPIRNRMRGGLAGLKVAVSSAEELGLEDGRTFEQWNNINGLGSKMLAMGNAGCDASTFLPADRVSAKPVLSWMKLLLRNSNASDIGVLGTTLEEGLIVPIAQMASRLGVRILTGISVESLDVYLSRLTGINAARAGSAGQERFVSDLYLSALPVEAFQKLITPALRKEPFFDGISRMRTVSSTSVIVWFDRPLPGLDKGPVLVESGIVRDFGTIGRPGAVPSGSPSIVQFLLSNPELGRRSEEDDRALVEATLRRFTELWPPARGATALKTLVLRIPHAMYAAYPGVERLRPTQRTPIENLFLAGDWTKHELNACMEGAFVSGMMAASEILKDQGLSPLRIQRADDEPLLKATKDLVRIVRRRGGEARRADAPLISKVPRTPEDD